MRFVTLLKSVIWLALFAAAAVALIAYAREHPEDMPWTPLDLGQPVGTFTGRKLTALTGEAAQCTALLERAGVRYAELAPRSAEAGRCGYDDGVRIDTGGARAIRYSPTGLGTSCAVAAALAMWEWEVVQPAALRHLGSRITSIDHYGSYSCRRIGGGREGAYSEHSTADAVDIAGFRTADGRRLTIAGDWNGDPAEAAFLRAVRDGACQLFATTLSPDYNAAHRDHLHLDQAERGAMGWRACR